MNAASPLVLDVGIDATTDTDPPSQRIPQGFAFVRSIGGIEEYRLDANSMRVLFMPMPAMPVALLMLTYAVGSRHEPAGLKGASHMLEHMMFRGSARFDKRTGNSIHALLHPVGAQTNATTWLDRTQYFDLVPVEHLRIAAEIEADRMLHLRIDPSDFEPERAVVLNEHDLYAGDPLERLHQAVWAEAFRSHPYGYPVIGRREDILGLTRDGLMAHYRRYYRPDNVTLTVFGDIARESTLELLHDCFGQAPAAAAAFECAESDGAAEPEQEGERRVVVEHADAAGLDIGMVMLAYRSPDGRHEDVDALEVLGNLLAGGKLCRLYRPLIASGLAIELSYTVSRLRDPGLFQIQAMFGESCAHAEVERAIRDAIDEIRRDGVSEQELDRARNRLRGSVLTSRDGPVAIALQINETIAAGDWTKYATLPQRISAVSADDVKRVAGIYLDTCRLTVGHLLSLPVASTHRDVQPLAAEVSRAR